jgi:hypothetical protein
MNGEDFPSVLCFKDRPSETKASDYTSQAPAKYWMIVSQKDGHVAVI